MEKLISLWVSAYIPPGGVRLIIIICYFQIILFVFRINFAFFPPMTVEDVVMGINEIWEDKKVQTKVFYIRPREESVLLVVGDVSRSYHDTEKLRVIFKLKMVKAMLTEFMAIYPASSTAENGHLCTSFSLLGLLSDL